MKKAVRNMLSLVLTAALVFAMVGCASLAHLARPQDLQGEEARL